MEVLNQETGEIPFIIGGRSVEAGEIFEVQSPHDHRHVLAQAHQATKQELT